MKWSFPSNNNSDVNGISNSGVETFQGTPLKSLAREICQNSLDAAIGGKPVEVEFMPFELDVTEFPDAESLVNAFKASMDFWDLQSSKKTVEFFKRALKMMNSGSIPFLRISDLNTTGLLGSKAEYNSSWCNLTKSSGASDKLGTAGGSFGIGKFAPFACSEFRTVFYSTLDSEGITAYQGISRITSFRKSENNEISIGVGYYGEERNMPVYSQLPLDTKFRRNKRQTGTDIFIAGFRFYSLDWKTDIIASVIDGFLYAIFSGKLIIRVDGIIISKETLPKLINDYKESLSENADNYYNILTSENTVWYKEDYRNDGQIELGLIIEPKMHRKVAMVRKTGMKILDRGNISNIIPFAGIMLIEGEGVNDFLRSIENPQHTKWEPDRIEPKSSITSARAYVKGLYDYIKECLDKLKQENHSDEIDPDVGQFLPDEPDIDSELEKAKKETETLQNTINSIEITIKPKIQRNEGKFISGEDAEAEDDNGNVIDSENVTGTGHTKGKDGENGDGTGNHSGNGYGVNAKEIKKEPIGIVAKKVRILCINKSAGEYSVTFVPRTSAKNGGLAFFLSAESQNYDAPIISVLCDDQPDLVVRGNQVNGLNFSANIPIVLKVEIDYYDFCSMEIKAYGN